MPYRPFAIDARRDASGHAAGDWPALWQQCVDVVERGAPAARDGPRLRWSAGGGWVPEGDWSDDARERFALYKPLLDRRPGDGGASRPWVIAQLGQSLDGFVATAAGDSRYVTGPQNLEHLHRLRALADAVLVGAGTVAADNPRLTTRLVAGRDPVRVVLDPRGALPRDCGVFTDARAPTLWLYDASARRPAAPAACECVAVDGLIGADGSVDPAPALALLHARALAVVFVEGGGVTVSRCLALGLLDRLHLAIAPLIIGRGRPGLQGAARERLADCLRPAARAHTMGADVLWDLDLRRAQTTSTST